MKRVFKIKEVIDILTSQGWYIEHEKVKGDCM